MRTAARRKAVEASARGAEATSDPTGESILSLLAAPPALAEDDEERGDYSI